MLWLAFQININLIFNMLSTFLLRTVGKILLKYKFCRKTLVKLKTLTSVGGRIKGIRVTVWMRGTWTPRTPCTARSVQCVYPGCTMCGKGDRNAVWRAQVQKGPHHYQARNESSPEMIIIFLHFALGFSNFSVRINYLCTCSVTKLVTPELSIIIATTWWNNVITRL